VAVEVEVAERKEGCLYYCRRRPLHAGVAAANALVIFNAPLASGVARGCFRSVVAAKLRTVRPSPLQHALMPG